MAVLTHALTIAAFVLSVLFRAPPLSFAGPAVAVIAALIAYAHGRGTPAGAAAHYEHALRTLVIGYFIWILAVALERINGALLTITLYIQLAVALWAILRAALALGIALTHRPAPNPHGWLV